MKKKAEGYFNRKIIQKLRKFNLLQRLMIFFVVLCFFPVIAFGLYFYSESSDELRAKLGGYSMEIVSQVQKNVSNRLRKVRNDSIDITLNEEVQEFMRVYSTSFPSERARRQTGLMHLLMNKFSFSTDIDDVLFISEEGNINYTYSNQKNKLYLNESCIRVLMDKTSDAIACWHVLTKNDCYRKSETYDKNEIGKLSTMEDHETSILFCSRIRTSVGEKRGYLAVNVKQDLVNELFRGTNIGTDTRLFMLDDKQMVVSTNYESLDAARIYPDADLRRSLSLSLREEPEQGVFDVRNGYGRDLAVYSRLQDIDWYILCRISGSYLNNESLNIGFSLLLMTALSLLVALAFAFGISASILNPLRKMIKVIHMVKGGNLQAKIGDTGRDELAIVANSFDEMTGEVGNLIARIREAENKKRELEFDALQAQIHPHFISNTLNSVAWLARMQKADNIVMLVNSLTYLLNRAMHKGSEMVKIRDEIDYIEKYITIQSYRFVAQIHLEIQIPEEMMEKSIPKFTIEPLVENSVVHGLAPDSKEINIAVKAVETDGDIQISVIDDGVGMTAGAAGCCSAGEDASQKGKRFHGIGLKNVDSRLKLYYGEKYGVSVFSIPNDFSIVSILIPGDPENKPGPEGSDGGRTGGAEHV